MTVTAGPAQTRTGAGFAGAASHHVYVVHPRTLIQACSATWTRRPGVHASMGCRKSGLSPLRSLWAPAAETSLMLRA
eukprot:1918338-Rhodomonas_salina.1